MRITEGKYSIAEMLDWYRTRNLVANNDYQRGSKLWPNSAKSYFIDTILKNYPFPKLYFHERLDRETARPRREIVDGQQRISTIVEFIDGKFRLGKNAGELEGNRFEDLPEEQRLEFLSYTVSVDVIRNADRSEILQMFRRMNAYTLPLNAAEKRQSEFFGEFKDWVNRELDRVGPVLVNWNVLTSRQVVRMADAELIADLVLAIEEGIVSTSPQKLKALYLRHDQAFEDVARVQERVDGAFNVVIESLSGIQGTYATRQHVFHSLLCALIHNRFGLPGVEEATGIAPTGEYFIDRERAVSSIRRLALAHEERDASEFAEYVRAASEGGNRALQRTIRMRWLCRALQGEFAQ